MRFYGKKFEILPSSENVKGDVSPEKGRLEPLSSGHDDEAQP
jgi:hypothetical protein